MVELRLLRSLLDMHRHALNLLGKKTYFQDSPGKGREGSIGARTAVLVLMDTNARTGRRGWEKLGREECKILGACDRYTLNDNGERLLSFSASYGLALLNTFLSTARNAVLHKFNGRDKIRFDFIFTRQQDRKLGRDVTVHPQPSFLPISDRNIVTAHVKLLGGRFARNRPIRKAKGPPPIDRRRPITDPHLHQEVATVI